MPLGAKKHDRAFKPNHMDKSVNIKILNKFLGKRRFVWTRIWNTFYRTRESCSKSKREKRTN
jgi:hypothetical protein